ncbi:MAG TPA: hypothetical protein VGE12_20420 [Noviherbaspirillum sp.]
MVIKNTFYLVFSGFIGGLGMLLLASGKFFDIDAALVSATIVFIAWQALGVTISKMGADQIIFATGIGNDRTIDIRPVVATKIVPAAAAFLLVSLTKYPILTAVLLFVSIVLDCVAILLQAKLNADLKVKKILVASLLNYPAFLVLLYGATLAGNVDFLTMVACFCVSSLMRFAYLVWIFRASFAGGAHYVRIEGSLTLGLYQGINYWIFRAGKIAAGLGIYAAHQDSVSKFIFFWTAIELIDRFNLSVTPIVYRRMVAGDARSNGIVIGAMSLALATLFLPFYWFSGAFLGMKLSWTYGAALTLNAMLLFLPNYQIFRATRAGDYAALVVAGVASCSLSGAMFAVMALRGDPLLALLLYAPSQMLLLSLFTVLFQAWPARSRSYDKSVATESV